MVQQYDDIPLLLPVAAAALVSTLSIVLCVWNRWISYLGCSLCYKRYPEQLPVLPTVQGVHRTEPVVFENLPPLPINNLVTVYHEQEPSSFSSMDRSSLRFNDTIGHGWFGWVVHGTVQGGTKVIVKILSDGATPEEINRFRSEHNVWEAVRNGNVSSTVLGCFTSFPLLSVLESADHLSLKTFLREESGKKNSTLQLQMSMDASAGLIALYSRGIVHNDLAARSCSIDKHMTLKLADYGLGQAMFPQDYWPLLSDSVPLRWCSPSQINKQEDRILPEYLKPTLQDNVWALGVLLWEILTWGSQPYELLQNRDVVNILENNVDVRHYFKVLKADEGCIRSRCLLVLLQKCLNVLTKDRPHPSLIGANLNNVSQAGELQLFQVYEELNEDNVFFDNFV